MFNRSKFRGNLGFSLLTKKLLNVLGDFMYAKY